MDVKALFVCVKYHLHRFRCIFNRRTVDCSEIEILSASGQADQPILTYIYRAIFERRMHSTPRERAHTARWVCVWRWAHVDAKN